MIDKVLNWFGVQIPALFAKYGWQASLAVIVVIVLLALGTVVVLRYLGVI